MKKNDLIPHLFRTEYSKIVAVLCSSFGIEHMEIAEDIASETFLMAVETWPYKGTPVNPNAWLYSVARNKAKNYFKRNQIFRDKIANELHLSKEQLNDFDIDLSDKNISDSQIQMLFFICNPVISEESQITLALRVLCGFGIDEIADAFLTNKDTINKRLHRAKEKLRSANPEMKIPDKSQLKSRLDTVLRTVYLLFSEGYYSESNKSLIRKDLCLEAINLTYMLLQNDLTNTHSTNALMSLLCFHSSRLEARLSEGGEIILYQDQDTNLWDTSLIEKGYYYLQQASKWEIVSKYYIEASIAYWHTVKTESEEKWESILHLYDLLLSIDYTPIVALNRIYALSKVKGKDFALNEAKKLDLEESHFYHLLLSELYNEKKMAMKSLKIALELSKTEMEKALIQKKINALSSLESS